MNMNIQESQRNPAASVDEQPGALPLPVGRREVFSRLRARGLSALAAAREAGYSDISPKNAQKLAQDKRVKLRVAYLTRWEESVIAELRQILLDRQLSWHESDIGEFFDLVEEPYLKDGEPVLNQDGVPLVRKVERLKPFSELSREQRMCIEGLTWTEKGKPNLKLYSKAEANKELRKLLGIDRPNKVAVTDAEGNDVPVTHEQRLRALAAIFARVQAELAAEEAASVQAGDASMPADGA
jgi:hypothetical protein